jgi:hypothetical protein
MFDRLAAFAHLMRITIEARLHSLKDGFVFPMNRPGIAGGWLV